MVRVGSARRLAAATAVGGGGLGLLGGTLYGVLRLEGTLARRTIGNADGPACDPSGLYGATLPGSPLRLAVLGDSAAAGYGAQVPEETFAAFLATGLSTLVGRPVQLRSVAVVGAQTTDLMEQIQQVSPFDPDVAAVIIGTNDITHRVRPADSIAALRRAVETLRAGSAQEALRSTATEVVVGTCPDMGTLRPLAPPLRQVARRWSRQLAAAQTIATVQAGGHSVSLGSLLGPHFDAAPGELFGPDRFHPSPAGYRSCAIAMLPTVANAVGGLPDDGAEPPPYRGERVFALARAAVIAAANSGTEVSPAGVAPPGRAASSRRALVLRRRRHAIPTVSEVARQLPDTVPDAKPAR